MDSSSNNHLIKNNCVDSDIQTNCDMRIYDSQPIPNQHQVPVVSLIRLQAPPFNDFVEPLSPHTRPQAIPVNSNVYHHIDQNGRSLNIISLPVVPVVPVVAACPPDPVWQNNDIRLDVNNNQDDEAMAPATTTAPEDNANDFDPISKLEEKRKRNRDAARRCRDKKLNQIKEYEKERDKLKEEIDLLKEFNLKLKLHEIQLNNLLIQTERAKMLSDYYSKK